MELLRCPLHSIHTYENSTAHSLYSPCYIQIIHLPMTISSTVLYYVFNSLYGKIIRFHITYSFGWHNEHFKVHYIILTFAHTKLSSLPCYELLLSQGFQCYMYWSYSKIQCNKCSRFLLYNVIYTMINVVNDQCNIRYQAKCSIEFYNWKRSTGFNSAGIWSSSNASSLSPSS